MRALLTTTVLAAMVLQAAWAQHGPQAQGPVSHPPAPPQKVRPAPGTSPSPATPSPVPEPQPAPVPPPGSGSQLELLDQVPELPSEVVERAIRFQAPPVARPFGLRLQYDGVLPQLRRADNPLQLLNPFAPAHYGSGLENLAINPINGRPEGICLFAIRF